MTLEKPYEGAAVRELRRRASDRIRIALSGTCTIVRIGDWPVPRNTARPVIPSRPIIAVSTDSPPSSMATIEATPLVGK